MSLWDFEQLIDQISRLPSKRATIQFIPGEKPGFSKVEIQIHAEKQWRVSATIDNQGSKQTGRQMVQARFEADDLFGVFDQWQLMVRGNKSFLNHQKYSRSLTVQNSWPLGYWTLKFLASWSGYASAEKGVIQDIQFSGHSQAIHVDLDRILHRNGTGKTGLTLGFAYKDSKNFVEDRLLTLSSHRLAILESRLYHTRRLMGMIASGSVSVSFGTPLFRSTRDRNRETPGPHAQFHKWQGEVSLYKPFSLGGHQGSLSTQVVGHLSPKNLFSSERISIGGPHTVRGFKEQNLIGDRGVYIRNDLTVNVFPGEKSPVLGYVGYDLGWIGKGHQSAQHGSLQGVGLGLKSEIDTTVGSVALDLGVTRSLRKPSSFKSEGLLFHFSMHVKF